MEQIKFTAIEGSYQHRFIVSQAKFPALIAAVGTGKTLALLIKVWSYCEQYPGSNALIVRKEFTDLRDSTMRDFERYFGVRADSDKNYRMTNGSLIMFRHASEVNVLKNLNLAIAGIDQAEDFDTDEVFQLLRDRMRQDNGAAVSPICVIANANGRNWLWKTWINQAQKVTTIDEKTGQYEYLGGEYACWTANTFANIANLKPDFIEDKRRQEKESPNHFRRMVMNSFEEEISDDIVFPIAELEIAKKADYPQRPGYGHRILACDPARFGNDKTAVVIIQQMGALHWEVIHLEEWQGQDAVYTVGRVNAIASKMRVDSIIIDEDGLGGPVGDFVRFNSQHDIVGFRNTTYSFEVNQSFGNARTKAAFKAKEMISKGWLKISEEKIIQELNSSFFFKYTPKGQRILVSKDELRREGIVSPNAGDAFCYAVSLIEEVKEKQDRQYAPLQTQSPDEDLFKIAGIR